MLATDAIFSLGGRQGTLSISSSDSLRSSLLSLLPLTFRVDEVNWSGTGRILGRRAPAGSRDIVSGLRGQVGAQEVQTDGVRRIQRAAASQFEISFYPT